MNNGIHRHIMNPPENMDVDHIDGQRNNNQKSNLRICTHAENMRNRNQFSGVSKYKGVVWSKPAKAWQASIWFNGRSKFLGYFTDEIAAANCYDFYAKKLFGEFALTNDCKYMNEEEWRSYQRVKQKTSKYRGVCFTDSKWLVQIRDGSKIIRVGTFDNEYDAAIAYDDKAYEIKGDKANLNFPERKGLKGIYK